MIQRTLETKKERHNTIQDKRTTGYIIAYIEPQGLVHRWICRIIQTFAAADGGDDDDDDDGTR